MQYQIKMADTSKYSIKERLVAIVRVCERTDTNVNYET